MTYRHQIAANGWRAVLRHEDGSHSTVPLICFEILCADVEDESEYSYYEPQYEDAKAKPKSGSAIEAVGLVFLEGHPQWKPSLSLAEAHTLLGFLGYLPPNQDLEEWLKSLPLLI